MKNIKCLLIIVTSALLFFTACSKQNSGKTNKNGLQSQTSKTAASQSKTLSPRALQGKKIAAHSGCMNCHTTNGKTLTGPTFKNLYGHQTTLKNGSTVLVDSLYIIQSMKNPSKQITAGYSAVMPDYSFLSDLQMENLVAYLRALSDGRSSQ